MLLKGEKNSNISYTMLGVFVHNIVDNNNNKNESEKNYNETKSFRNEKENQTSQTN